MYQFLKRKHSALGRAFDYNCGLQVLHQTLLSSKLPKSAISFDILCEYLLKQRLGFFHQRLNQVFSIFKRQISKKIVSFIQSIEVGLDQTYPKSARYIRSQIWSFNFFEFIFTNSIGLIFSGKSSRKIFSLLKRIQRKKLRLLLTHRNLDRPNNAKNYILQLSPQFQALFSLRTSYSVAFFVFSETYWL